MAIEKVIKIDVDQVKAMGGLTAFQQSLEKTEEKSQSLKAELAQLKRELATLDEGTEQYQTIAKRAGEVSDKIGDINTKIKNLGSDTKNIDAVVQGAQTLSGAFTVATSATQLFGVENEDLQKSMAKVEAAIGLTVGIQSIANALQKESALSIGLASAATKIQMGLQIAYTAVVGGTTGALKALRVALVSTGVGALVVILGYLISKMMESTEATEDQTQAQERLNDALEKSNKYFSEEANSINDVTKTRILRAKIAGQSEQDLQKIEGDAHKERLANLKAEQNRLYELLNDKNINLETSKKINDALDKNNKAFMAELNADDQRRLTYQLEIADKQRENEKKLSEDLKKKAEERRKELEEQRKKDLEDLRAFQLLMWNTQLQNSADRAVDEHAEKERQKAGQIKAWEEAAKIDEEFNAKSVADAQATADAKKNIREAELNNIDAGIGLLKTLAGKNKALQITALIAESAVGISKIIMNTNVANAVAKASPINAIDPSYGARMSILNRISMGIGIASNLVALKSGLSALGGGGGGSAPSGGGSDSGSASTPPSFNIVGQNSNNQLAQTIAQQQQQPLQAYVVSGNITNAQVLDRNRIDTATFN